MHSFPADRPSTSVERSYTWRLAVSGLLFSASVAHLICHLPNTHSLSWTKIVLRSAVYIAVASIAGVVGIWLPWRFLPVRLSASPISLATTLGVGWIFFPCIALLYTEQSPWMFGFVALATLIVTFCLRVLFPAGGGEGNVWAEAPSELQSLYGLPPADSHPLRSVWIAVCAQAAVFLAVSQYPFYAGVALSTSLFLLLWRWSASDTRAARLWEGRAPRALLCGIALLSTVIVLTPWVNGVDRGRSGRNPAHARSPTVPHPTKAQTSASAYVGIILWPPPAKKTAVLPPAPRSNVMMTGSKAKPVVIPFDGAYWYFKAPYTDPGPQAHIAHGKPTDTASNIRSTDSSPLRMEAHQHLGVPIDLANCGEIDVTITNNDTRPGKMSLGLVLTDSTVPAKPVQSLGEQTLTTSSAGQIPFNTPPRNETLRFAVPQAGTIRRFDQITIVFIRPPDRSRLGAKVGIQSFELRPK